MCMRIQYSYPNLLIVLFVRNAMYNVYTQVVYVCVCVCVCMCVCECVCVREGVV